MQERVTDQVFSLAAGEHEVLVLGELFLDAAAVLPRLAVRRLEHLLQALVGLR